MRKLLIGLSLAIATVIWGGEAVAQSQWQFWPYWPAYHPDAPYWPYYRPHNVPVGENCVRWNWQELSYYNYCGSPYSAYRPARSQRALHVRN